MTEVEREEENADFTHSDTLCQTMDNSVFVGQVPFAKLCTEWSNRQSESIVKVGGLRGRETEKLREQVAKMIAANGLVVKQSKSLSLRAPKKKTIRLQ